MVKFLQFIVRYDRDNDFLAVVCHLLNKCNYSLILLEKYL